MKPTALLLVTIGLLLTGSDASSATTTARQKPNFVVIFSDDQTYRVIGYNNPAVQTPHVDRLVAEGMRFDRAKRTISRERA